MPLEAFLTTFLIVLASVQPPLPTEKGGRTPAQQKIDSQLLFEIYRLRGESERRQVPSEPTGVRIDARGRALVDVRAAATPALERRIRRLGGTVVSTSARHQSTIARVPLLKLEELAADRSVRFIEPAAEAITNRPHESGIR
jgi:hypothetical protein